MSLITRPRGSSPRATEGSSRRGGDDVAADRHRRAAAARGTRRRCSRWSPPAPRPPAADRPRSRGSFFPRRGRRRAPRRPRRSPLPPGPRRRPGPRSTGPDAGRRPPDPAVRRGSAGSRSPRAAPRVRAAPSRGRTARGASAGPAPGPGDGWGAPASVTAPRRAYPQSIASSAINPSRNPIASHRVRRRGRGPDRRRIGAPGSPTSGWKPGSTNPPFRPLAPHPTRCRSSTVTATPCRASVRAAESPVYPPPTTATSVRSGRAAGRRPGGAPSSQRHRSIKRPLSLPRQPVRQIDQRRRHQQAYTPTPRPPDRVEGARTRSRPRPSRHRRSWRRSRAGRSDRLWTRERRPRGRGPSRKIDCRVVGCRGNVLPASGAVESPPRPPPGLLS